MEARYGLLLITEGIIIADGPKLFVEYNLRDVIKTSRYTEAEFEIILMEESSDP